MALKFTADQVRDRSSAQIGKGKRPNAWWAWSGPSDCMAAQAWILGIRTDPRSVVPHEISIAAFRAHFGWDEVPMDQATAGMLVCENWTGADNGRAVEHIEYIHTIDRAAGTITTDSGNTNAIAGGTDPTKIGFWRKTRPLSAHFLFAIVVPYRGAADTSPYGAKAPTPLLVRNVKLVAGFLNERAKDLGCTETTSVKDGVVGPRYWTLVQTWGRKNGIYGPGYLIDGIVGPRTRNVEAVILKRAQAVGKK